MRGPRSYEGAAGARSRSDLCIVALADSSMRNGIGRHDAERYQSGRDQVARRRAEQSGEAMTRRALERGLRHATERRRAVDERSDRIAAAGQAHAEAVESRRQHCLLRIIEAQGKADGKPVAAAGLARLFARAEKCALRYDEFMFLLVIESRLAKGDDIEQQEPKRRPLIQSKRPEWMRDASLLPKRPPGR